MADAEPRAEQERARKKKKRRPRSPEVEPRVSKTSRVSGSKQARETSEAIASNREEVEEGRHPWRNLQLILSIQNRNVDVERKIELAYDFVNSKSREDSEERGCETVGDSQLVVVMNNWIQSLLISSKKEVSGGGESCLDVRCWCIFKFCLEESTKLHVSLSLSRDLLRAICCIVKDALSVLSKEPLHSKISLFSGEGFELYSTALDCMTQAFTSHGGVSNANLESWILATVAVVEAVNKIYADDQDGGSSGDFLSQFACLVLEPSAKFLRVHPCRKNAFHDFVDKLLEPLLQLLNLLHLQLNQGDSGCRPKLLALVNEVLSYGLFHSAHVDGFLAVRSTAKYHAPHDGKPRDDKTIILSYHRHLFDRLEKLIAEKKVLALEGIGELFHVFVNQVKCQIKVSVLSQDPKKEESLNLLEGDAFSPLHGKSSMNDNFFTKKSSKKSSLNAETRKGVFDFFAKIMEPMLQQISSYCQTKLEVGSLSTGFHLMIKSMNKLLASCIHENVYLRMEDTSEESHRHFLKAAYDIVMSCSTKISLLWLSLFDVDKGVHVEALKLLVKDLIVAIRYFLEIEYEVTGNDLVSLWLMMLSYLVTDNPSLTNATDKCSLATEILDLGCKLIFLYGELRQVNNIVFALCKAARLLVSRDSDDEMDCATSIYRSSSLSHEAYVKSVGVLLSAQKFRFALYSGIKSIPEGQANDFIHQLTKDISESLTWLKDSCSTGPEQESGLLNVGNNSILDLNLRTELLGRVASEIYTLVLDSLTVTAGNSSSVRVSIEGLMTVIRPSMCSLVAQQTESSNMSEFLYSIIGGTSKFAFSGNENNVVKFGPSTQWILLFFFRLYMSCRSIYRGAMSLVPPDASKKMASLIGDITTGRDLMERTRYTDGGYFFWIHQSSVSLLTVVLSVSDTYLQDGITDCSQIVYVLHAMAVQRLVDLNRQTKSLEFLLQKHDLLKHMNLTGDAAHSVSYKKCKMWKRCISVFQEEAAGLTSFMMSCLPKVAEKRISNSDFKNTISNNACGKNLIQFETWNLNVCTVNSNTLPAAIWSILCHNIDVWCSHAAKKKLKKFLLLLIETSILCKKSIFGDIGLQMKSEFGHLGEAAICKISAELLRNTVLYEQKFVCRYLASSFCCLLKKLILPIFSDSCGDVDLKRSLDWQELLSTLNDSQAEKPASKEVLHGCHLFRKLNSHATELPNKCYVEQQTSPGRIMKIEPCLSLLRLLSWMPKGFSAKSFSRYVYHIINIERFLVARLLNCLPVYNQCELFRLFVSCRRALKYLIVAPYVEKMEDGQFSLAQIHFEGPLPFLWLVKSIYTVVGLQHASAMQLSDLIIPLVDHTSHIFLTLSKMHFRYVVHYIMNSDRSVEERDLGTLCENRSTFELDSCLESFGDVDAWRSMFLIANTLKEQINLLLAPLKESFNVSVVNFNRLSSTVSCIQGFLWGLASAMDHIKAKSGNPKKKRYRWKQGWVSELNVLIDEFADLIYFLSCILILENNQWPKSLCVFEVLSRADAGNASLAIEENISSEGFANGNDMLQRTQQNKAAAANQRAASSEIGDGSERCSVSKKQSLSEKNDPAAIALGELDSFELQWLNRSFLQRLLVGENAEEAYLLKHLFIASSAILRLQLLFNSTPLSSRLLHVFVGASQFLLYELSEMIDVPPSFVFVWLDGILKYVEELGDHFPLLNPTLSKNMYEKLIELNLRAIGRCISWQGKRAALTFHETESSTKILDDQVGSSDKSLTHGSNCVDEFKTRLRMSFKRFIWKPAELHLSSAMQILERALVGAPNGITTAYQINSGSAGSGKASPIAAAAIDCLDLVLEFASGRKRVDVVKRHIHSITCSILNIIVHLHGPFIFLGNLVQNKGVTDHPDSGSVILMGVEVLTRIFGRHGSYKMDSFIVAQSLHVAAMLFRDLHQFRLSESIAQFLPSLNGQDCKAVARESSVDKQFSINLYAACCRLLYTVLKHYQSTCEQCIALLEDSVRVLLHCLERENTDSATGNDYLFELQEGITCASFLRRVYEEIRQQRDVFGRHSFKFLSSYIWLYSGYGPLQTGIRREIDEALRPGVYALIDACSADDLQHLHTVFGEGPCRNTLAALQHAYKLNFQYEGKV